MEIASAASGRKRSRRKKSRHEGISVVPKTDFTPIGQSHDMVIYMKRRGDSSTSTIEIAVDHSGADTVVRLKGRVDVDSSPDVRDRLRAILSSDPLPHAVIVELGDVTSIEASGIATLIEALKVARHREIRFHLQGHGSVFQLFESAGLLALFDKSSGGNGAS
jgi:anti-anti-sigma factor